MNVARDVLRDAGMNYTYWTMGVIDTVYKQNLLERSTTGHILLYQWNDNTVPLPPLHVFGKVGRVTNVSIKDKFQSRGQLVRYLGFESRQYIRVEHTDGRIAKVRTKDFHPIHKQTDPTPTIRWEFEAFTKRL